MSSRTVRFKISVARRRRRAAPGAAEPVPPATPQAAEPAGPSRAARMLALAHHVERLIEAGELSGYAEAARSLGLTRARLTQVMKLLLLAPQIQEKVLTGKLDGTERSFRGAVREPIWVEQVGGDHGGVNLGRFTPGPLPRIRARTDGNP